MPRLTIDTGGPARVEVRDAHDVAFRPPDAVTDRTTKVLAGMPTYYQSHFISSKTVALDLPNGLYTVVVEKGTEFFRVSVEVELTRDESVVLRPERWINMAARRWWSADFHIHRPIEEAALLLRAEHLNLGVFFTMWNDYSIWENSDSFGRPTQLLIDPEHIATLANAEDERGGGAWMLHNLANPLSLEGRSWWYPTGDVVVEQARAGGAWFDSEKPTWWEVPVMMVVAPPDSIGVLNNHYLQYGMAATGGWGRLRDESAYPGYEGFSDHQLSVYYHFLNCGFRLPASAGSASGVMPGPPGYNRVYVPLPNGLSVEGFYGAVREGKSFVTNGPMISFSANGASAGDTVVIEPGAPIHVKVRAESSGVIERTDIVANGRVVATGPSAELDVQLATAGVTWIVVRSYEQSADTVRLAHSSPIYLVGPAQQYDARVDYAYFVDWLDELLETTVSDPDRFDNEDQMAEVVALYIRARAFYVDGENRPEFDGGSQSSRG